MITDVSKSSDLQLFAAIVAANAGTIGSLSRSDVSFGNPVAGSIDHGAGQREVDIVVTANANTGVSGSVTVGIDRLDLNDFSTVETPEVHVAQGATVADIIVEFNALYGAALSVDDYDAGLSAPVPDDDGEFFTLVANANSLAYTGSIQITVFLSSVALSTVITNTDLGGLTLAA